MGCEDSGDRGVSVDVDIEEGAVEGGVPVQLAGKARVYSHLNNGSNGQR